MYNLTNLKNQLVDLVMDGCVKVFKITLPTPLPKELLGAFRLPAPTFKHSLQFGCYGIRNLVKGVKPVKVAKDVAEHISANLGDHEIIREVKNQGVFVNFFFKVSYLAKSTIPYIHDGQFFTSIEPKNERVMVEYSQPNTHKVFHVGHMRNVALGHSIIQLYRHVGYDVVAANYIGDVGAHIAKCLWYYETFYEKKDENDIDKNVPEGMQRVEWLGSMYSSAVEAIDFGSWTVFPYIGTVTARVLTKTPHPSVPNWNVVTLTDGKEEKTVVCGGTHYDVDDVIAYAPIGSKFKGRSVDVVDKKGVESHGIILGEEELGIIREEEETEGENEEEGQKKKQKKKKKKKKKQKGKTKNTRIHLFPKETLPGLSLAELGRLPSCPLEKGGPVGMEEEMEKRTKGWQNVLTRIEEKDPETVALWEKTREWSLKDFSEIYKWIGAEFDHFYYESEVEEPSKKYILDLEEKGIMVNSHGAVGMDLSKHGLGFAMALTSAGNGLYLTKDLELARRKFEDFKIDRCLYVVDVGQSFHFKQVFKTLEILGFPQAKKCAHIAYGLVTLPGGKMSSRSGSIIPFSKLKEEISTTIQKEYFDLNSPKISPKKKEIIENMTPEEIDDAIHKIAMGTIRYGMLNQDNNRQIVFKMDQWVSTRGNTGPYIMYAYTRIKSILRKNELSEEQKKEFVFEGDYTKIPEDTRFVLQKLNQFEEIVSQSAETNKPSTLCTYLFQLCQMFSTMYEKPSCSVFRSESVEIKCLLLKIYSSIAIVLKKGLELLGIKTLEYM